MQGPPIPDAFELEVRVNGTWSLIRTGGELSNGEHGYKNPAAGMAICPLFYYTFPDQWAVYQHRVGVGKWQAPY